MYVPRFNQVQDDAEIRAMVAGSGVGELITTADDGYPRSTLLPVLWEGDRVIAHFARANPHWQTIASDAPALLVCAGAGAYVSPAWYATKAEHGRVVPTWNYSSVHLTGRVRVHEDVAWLRDAVTRLTDHHESGRPDRWHVGDAPATYIDGQLRGIVGVEMIVEKVEGKAKLSQNRSEEDRRGVVEGLSTGSAEDTLVADQMRAGLS